MNANMAHKKCPICQSEATVGEVEIEGDFPEDRTEIHCGTCGDYHVVTSKITESEGGLEFPSLKGKKLDIDKISHINSYARSEGKVVLWLDSFDDVVKWNLLLDRHAEHFGGYRPFVIEVLNSHIID